MKLVHVAPIKTWIRFERGTKEQTEHLQTGLMRTVPGPRYEPLSQAPFALRCWLSVPSVQRTGYRVHRLPV
jgi:hypothetical protein